METIYSLYIHAYMCTYRNIIYIQRKPGWPRRSFRAGMLALLQARKAADDNIEMT